MNFEVRILNITDKMYQIKNKFIFLFLAKKKSKSKIKKLTNKPLTAVVGDLDANVYLQTTGEFTDNRIRSFISLIKDHPNLIRLFTACQK